MKEEQIPIRFPNLDPQLIPVSVIEKWDVIKTNEIGDTIFCTLGDNTHISMNLSDYKKIFETQNGL